MNKKSFKILLLGFVVGVMLFLVFYKCFLTKRLLPNEPFISPPRSETPSNLSGIRTIYYWNLQSEPEGLENATKIINELDPDFIWYAHWIVGFPMPRDNASAYEIAKSCGFSEKEALRFEDWCKKTHYTLEDVKKQVDAVGDRLYIPCILGYSNFRTDFNFDPVTFECYSRERINKMLLNFGKWNITNPETGRPYTLNETQQFFKKIASEMGVEHLSNRGVFDLSSPEFINYTLKKARALKSVGVKAVWYDLYFQLPWKLAKFYGFDHPMIKDLYKGGCEIINRTKEMGLIVGTWVSPLRFPYKEVPKLDFVTETPMSYEVLNLKPDYNRWDEIAELVKEKCPNCTLIIMFDFAGWSDDLPLAVFSQKLTPEQQCEFLKELDNLARYIEDNYGIKTTVAYPVHGYGLGKNPKKLAWGKYDVYDATAPEFDTYECIKNLLH